MSAEANRLLTAELQAALGGDTVEIPADSPDHSHDRHATHSSMMASLIEVRFYVVLILPVLMIAAMVVFIQDWIGVIVLAAAVLVVGLLAVVVVFVRMTGEVDHLDPDTAALLSAEGVGDPDRLFTELLAEYRGPAKGAGPHGMMSTD